MVMKRDPVLLFCMYVMPRFKMFLLGTWLEGPLLSGGISRHIFSLMAS